MEGQYYLSDILTDDSRLLPHQINMITGYVGCGKSEYALNVLPKFAQSNYCMLVLTDTRMNVDQIITHKENTTEYSVDWRKFINDNTKAQIVAKGKRNIIDWATLETETIEVSITTLTYAKVGAILYYGHSFDWSKFDFIVCDELDSLISFSRIPPKKGEPNILWYTINKIWDTLNCPDVKIIGMTATPYKVYKEFGSKVVDILTPEELLSLRKYEIDDIWYYSEYGKVLQAIPQGHRGIVYFDRINTIKTAESILISKGHKTGSFWSLKNEKHPMTQEQIDLRKYIIDNQMIPPDIDIVLFNATAKTGINIRNKDITFMLIHAPVLHLRGGDVASDTLEQVRGRVRNDLRTVFYHKKTAEDHPNPVPVEYLNRELTADETEALCGEIRYMKPKKTNEYYKWGEVKKYLKENGYEIKEKRAGHGGKTRVSVITKN